MSTKKHLDDLKKQLDNTGNDNNSLPAIPIVEDNKELTDKQLRFIDEYMVDLNATQAAIRSEISTEVSASVTAHRMLTNVNVKKELKRRQQEDIIKNGIKRADTYKMLLDTINEVNERLTFNIEKEFNLLIMTKLKAIDMLNKMGGFYNDINLVQNNININNDIDVKKLFGFEDEK